MADDAQLRVRRQDRELLLDVSVAVEAGAVVCRDGIDDHAMRAEVLPRERARREARDVLRRGYTACVNVPGLVLDLVDRVAHKPTVARGTSST